MNRHFSSEFSASFPSATNPESSTSNKVTPNKINGRGRTASWRGVFIAALVLGPAASGCVEATTKPANTTTITGTGGQRSSPLRLSDDPADFSRPTKADEEEFKRQAGRGAPSSPQTVGGVLGALLRDWLGR